MVRIPRRFGKGVKGAVQRTREERTFAFVRVYGGSRAKLKRAVDSKTMGEIRKRDKSRVKGRSRNGLNPNYDDPEAR